jgi:hypothetical protein
MKFVYVDETGARDEEQTDVFVMVGLLIDAYRLRKYTWSFDAMIKEFLAKHPKAPEELKTKRLINGVKGWSKIDRADRMKFLADVCDLAADCATVFAVALSFEKFGKAANDGHGQPFGKNYWLGGAMFIAALVQKKMKKEPKNKGLTVFICDDNKMDMPKFSDGLYKADPWFDPIYQTCRQKKGKAVWSEVPDHERFDQIINSGFAIKSEHSSLVQVADAVAYAYRRHLELKSDKEEWVGEQQYFASLVERFEEPKEAKKPKRERLGRTPGGPCIEFYKAACHREWKL